VQPIDISGTIRSGVRTASLGLEAAQLEYERAKNDLILSVTNAYEGVARAQAFVVVAEEALKNSQERLRITQVQLDTGVAAQFDLLRAQTQVAQNEQAVIGARNTLDLAKANLNNILGRDLSHPVQIEEQSSLPPMEQELDALVQTAMQMRPEVQAAEKNIQIANRNIFNAKRGILPNLALSGQMDFNFNTSTFNPRNSSFTALAVLSVPVMDGGVTDARVEQARSDLKIAQITAAQIKEGVALEVRNAFLNLRDAKQKLEVAERGIAQATEGLRLARVRFEAGVSTPLEISDAEVAYTQAQTNRVNARYDYLNAYAALQRATGKIGERYL
jgi:outer membrane protein TolC